MQEKLIVMLPIQEVALKSGIAEHAIRKWIRENKIVYVKTGRKHLVNWDKFIEFLNKGEQEKVEPEEIVHMYGKVRKVY